jgi:hypothetical protein
MVVPMPLYSKRVSSLDLSDIRIFDKDGNPVSMPDLSSLTMRLGDVVLLVALSKDKSHLEVTVTKPKQAVSAIKVAL